MGKIIAICGKICGGKSYYANELKNKENAVVLSCDELTSILFDNNLGDKHDEMSKRIWEYLLKKSCDIVSVGCNVILDWGFWSKNDRAFIKKYFFDKGINLEMHYIDVDDATWQKNISERNKKVLDGNGGSDFYLDDGLLQKLLGKWQTPDINEIDVWYKLKR